MSPHFSAVLSRCPSPAPWKPRHLVRIHPKSSSPSHLQAPVLLGNNQTESQDIWAVEEQEDVEEEEKHKYEEEEEEKDGEEIEHTTKNSNKSEATQSFYETLVVKQNTLYYISNMQILYL